MTERANPGCRWPDSCFQVNGRPRVHGCQVRGYLVPCLSSYGASGFQTLKGTIRWMLRTRANGTNQPIRPAALAASNPWQAEFEASYVDERARNLIRFALQHDGQRPRSLVARCYAYKYTAYVARCILYSAPRNNRHFGFDSDFDRLPMPMDPNMKQKLAA